ASARRAGERGDHPAAANLLERALVVGLSEPHARADSQLQLAAWVGGLLGRLAERDALLAEVAEAATGLGDRALITRVRLVEAEATATDPEELRRIVEGAMATLSELGDGRGLASADGIYGGICVREGRMADA